MKFIFIVLAIAFLSPAVFAQISDDSIPAYMRIPTVPPFKLMLAPDSMPFTKDQLKKKKPVIIMIFSPDCDHCLHSTEDMLAQYNDLKKAEIIMATALAFQHVKKFYRDYKLADYPAVKAGMDNTNFLGLFYEVRSYPAIYLYDKKGKFKAFFGPHTKWKEIAKSL
ncbi:MAG: hypothetical protein WKF88_11025 [Ferruginibacter sp.]